MKNWRGISRNDIDKMFMFDFLEKFKKLLLTTMDNVQIVSILDVLSDLCNIKSLRKF